LGPRRRITVVDSVVETLRETYLLGDGRRQEILGFTPT
jgi:hypothetical protein